MASWFATSPCYMCNEESALICMCRKVYLCIHCLPVHLKHDVSKKHNPLSLESPNLCIDEIESQKKQVSSSIISKMQNELLQIQEFKKIVTQKIIDYLNNLRLEIEKFSEDFLKTVEDECKVAEEEIKSALNLCKFSFNVNNPVLDLFRNCKSSEEVKVITVTKKEINFDNLDIASLIQNHIYLKIHINRDLLSRVFPAKSPADTAPMIRHITNISMGSITSFDESFSSNFTYSGASPETDIKRKYSNIWEKPKYDNLKEHFSVNMELQVKGHFEREARSLPVSEYRPPTMYIFETYSNEIFSINLDNLQKNVLFVNHEKLFPQSAWCITEDDKLIITGGFDGTPRNSVVLFNLKSRKTEKSQNMLQPRYNHALVCCGKYVYAIGGFFQKSLKECEKFCLIKKDWKKVGKMNVARENCAVCTQFNLIYIFGGNGIESIEMYSPYKKKFTLLTIRLPFPGRCCIFPYDSQIFVLQKDKIFVADTTKKILKESGKIESKEWWSPTEPIITINHVYFISQEQVFRFSVNDFQVDSMTISD